jgi:hypothetical protein
MSFRQAREDVNHPSRAEGGNCPVHGGKQQQEKKSTPREELACAGEGR